MGPKGTYALHRWLISILWKAAEASRSEIRNMVVPKGLYVVTRNDVIGYFRSATNSVNAKYFFSMISKLLEIATSKIIAT